MTPMLWAFEQREMLMEFYGVFAARGFMQPIIELAVSIDLPAGLPEDITRGQRSFQSSSTT